MIIIPAIDLKDGKCVRLFQGRMEDETVFSEDPLSVAKRWCDEGAQLLHIVDLDGAVEKHPKNLKTIKQIVDHIDIPIQVGGGIRSLDTIKMYLELGVEKIIIGTEAVKNPKLVAKACALFPNQIVVGIDARDGYVAIEGWTESTQTEVEGLAKQFENQGVSAIVFTDIHRDGMRSGVNIDATKRLAEAISIPVIASGGVATLDDINKLVPLYKLGVIGVITGRALYEGSLSLKEATTFLEKNASSVRSKL